MGAVGAGFAITLGTLAAYAVWVVRKGRKTWR